MTRRSPPPRPGFALRSTGRSMLLPDLTPGDTVSASGDPCASNPGESSSDSTDASSRSLGGTPSTSASASAASSLGPPAFAQITRLQWLSRTVVFGETDISRVESAGVAAGSTVTPRIPDHRRSLAVRTLACWHQHCVDVPPRIGWRSTSPGHRKRRYTYHYLSAAPELWSHGARLFNDAQELRRP
jgi:hypothetical protein